MAAEVVEAASLCVVEESSEDVVVSTIPVEVEIGVELGVELDKETLEEAVT